MSWIFRKIFHVGLFRGTLSKRGVGASWGIPGFRIGISASGKKYITIGIPRTGLYFTKYLNSENPQSQSQSPTQTKQQDSEPWWKQKHLND